MHDCKSLCTYRVLCDWYVIIIAVLVTWATTSCSLVHSGGRKYQGQESDFRDSTTKMFYFKCILFYSVFLSLSPLNKTNAKCYFMRSPRPSHEEIRSSSSAPESSCSPEMLSSAVGEHDWNQKARLMSVETGSQLPVASQGAVSMS